MCWTSARPVTAWFYRTTANSALFFVVVLAHIQLRNILNVPAVLYLEYFYFTMYLTLLATSVYALAFTSRTYVPDWVRRDDGLIIKLAFWPLLYGISLLVTVVALGW